MAPRTVLREGVQHRGSAAKAAFNDCPAKDANDGAHLAAFVRCSPLLCVTALAPRGPIIYGLGKSLFKPFRTSAGLEVPIDGLDDPGQVLVRSSIQVDRRRHGLEDRRESLAHRDVVQHVAKFLHDTPREGIADIDRKLDPPGTAGFVPLAERASEAGHSRQEGLEGRKGALISHDARLYA